MCVRTFVYIDVWINGYSWRERDGERRREREGGRDGKTDEGKERDGRRQEGDGGK